MITQYLINIFRKTKTLIVIIKEVQINSETILDNEDDFKKSIWYDFIQYHNSIEFFEQLINIFDKDLIKIYPSIKKIFNEKK